MPILLTTPKVFDPGHEFPSENYTHVTLIDFQVKIIERLATFVMQYGSIGGGGEWVAGQLPNRTIAVHDTPAVEGRGLDSQGNMIVQELVPASYDFSVMASQLVVVTGHVGLDFLTALGADLYQYFLDNGPTGPVSGGHNPYYYGTVVP